MLRNPLAGVGVAHRLLRHDGESRPRFFGLYDAKSLAINEEDVVGRTALRAEFADCDATRGGEVQLVAVLDDPACGAQLSVDGLAVEFLWGGHVICLPKS